VATNAQNRSIDMWFKRISGHETVLPRFQRFEAWTHANVAQLFNTILRDLPVGALLVLEIGDEEPFVSRTIKGAPDGGGRVTEHLLDGQQRLTALWRGLHNNYDDRTYFLFLESDAETGMPCSIRSIARYTQAKTGVRMPAWANNPAAQWRRHAIPLELCLPGEDGTQRFRAWAKEAIADRDERDEVVDKVSLIRTKFSSFNLPFLSLPVSTDKETALDVFIKMNTSAEPLSTYDIVVAQVEAALNASLHELVADVRESCPAMESYYPAEELVLAASALLQGREATTKTYLSRDFGPQLLDNWQLLLKGIARATAFLEDERIFDAQRLPTDVVVPVLVSLWARAPEGLDAEGRARAILRRYLWRAFFTARYESSTNSRSLVDHNAVNTLIGVQDAPLPAILDDAQFSLPLPEELIGAAWPKKKDRLARATLALALRHGGLDLADGAPATKANLSKREYHHLFPVALLSKDQVPEERIFRALNCALVTWHTNRNIGAKAPERYLAERRDGTELTEDELRSRLVSHLIPYAEMVSGNYNQFLEVRAALMTAEMIKLCS
jgi:hypothetical protein